MANRGRTTMKSLKEIRESLSIILEASKIDNELSKLKFDKPEQAAVISKIRAAVKKGDMKKAESLAISKFNSKWQEKILFILAMDEEVCPKKKIPATELDESGRKNIVKSFLKGRGLVKESVEPYEEKVVRRIINAWRKADGDDKKETRLIDQYKLDVITSKASRPGNVKLVISNKLKTNPELVFIGFNNKYELITVTGWPMSITKV